MVKLVRLAFIATAILLLFQMVRLQIFDFEQLKDKALRMRTKKAQVFRGEIFDRNGLKLASDATVYDIYAHPHYYKEEETPEDVARLLSPILKIEQKKLLLDNLNPKNLLEKGYAIIYDENNKIIDSVEVLNKQKTIIIQLKDGKTKFEGGK